MKIPWWASLILIPVLTGVALLFLVWIIPENNSAPNPLNRLLPLRGKIVGAEPDAWLGDLSGKRMGGRKGTERPPGIDVDYIRVKTDWYKIKGPVYLTKDGKLFGWHQKTTFRETGYVGKWASFLDRE